MYVRRVRAGEFIVVNPHLLGDLVERGLWTKEVSCSRGLDQFRGRSSHIKFVNLMWDRIMKGAWSLLKFSCSSLLLSHPLSLSSLFSVLFSDLCFLSLG